MSADKTDIRRRWRLAAVVLLCALAVAAVTGHAYAQSLEKRARDQSVPVDTRLAAARRATSFEPWDESIRVTLAIAEAQSFSARGEIDRAYFLLLPYSRTVRDDELFRQTYQDVLAKKWVIDARKAHQQHAKEKKGGALDEKDVFK